jgi:hypothetical protein
MKFYTFIFLKDADGNVLSSLSVPENQFVRTPGGPEVVPSLVSIGDQVRLTPHPRAVQTVIDIITTDQED